MLKPKVVKTKERRNEFVSHCDKHQISNRVALWILANLRDPESFSAALDLLNPTHQKKLSNSLVQLVRSQITEMEHEKTPGSEKLSKRKLLKAGRDARKKALVLRQDVADFLALANPSAEFLPDLSTKKRTALRSSIRVLESTLDAMDDLTRTLSFFVEQIDLHAKGRDIKILGNSLEQFNRSLARLWKESGQTVTMTNDGKFAQFLEVVHGSFRKSLRSLTNSLTLAGIEDRAIVDGDQRDRTGIHDNRRKAGQQRHTKSFNESYRGRNKRGIALADPAHGALEEDEDDK